ncbi:MAG: pilus assembly protein TadG-related protein [Nocardioidaceae bacterium]
MTRGDQRGQTSLLIIGFAIVGVMMVALVVDASSAYLRRSGLDSLADGAALAAADGIAGQRVYEGGLGDRAQIDPALARQYVEDYLSATGAARRYPGLHYVVETAADRVVVRLATPLDLPIVPPGWDRRPVVSGTAASVVEVDG